MSGFEIVALVIAAPEVVERIAKIYKDVTARVRAVNDPKSSMGNLSGFDRGLLLEAQFQAGRAYCESSTKDMNIAEKLNVLFLGIQTSLRDALDYIDKIEKSSKSHRFWVKNEPKRRLSEASNILQIQISDFNDVIQLIARTETQSSYLELSLADFQWTSGSVGQAVAADVFYMKGDLTRRSRGIAPRHGWFICEKRPYQSQDKHSVEKSVRYLAERLASTRSGPISLILIGFRDNSFERCFELIFDPANATWPVQTLADVLSSHCEMPSLNVRINLCKQMADAVLQVHQLDMVHKSVRTQNLLLMWSDEAKKLTQCRVSLVNWRMLRRSDAATQRLPDPDPLMRIYQHPSRQTQDVEERYTMAHDIYSLGICMIEVLLWLPLVNAPRRQPAALSDAFEEELRGLGVDLTRNHCDDDTHENDDDDDEICESNDNGRATNNMNNIDVSKTRQAILDLAQSRLPAVCGEILTRLVSDCLNVVEEGFGSKNLIKKDSVETGLNYMTAVKTVLQDIRI